MENIIYVVLTLLAGAFGYSKYLKSKTNKGQADLEKQLAVNKEKISNMESDLNENIVKNNKKIKELEHEKNKDLFGEDIVKFFNDYFNHK